MFLGYVGIFFEKFNAWEEKAQESSVPKTFFAFKTAMIRRFTFQWCAFKKSPWKFKDYYGCYFTPKQMEWHGAPTLQLVYGPHLVKIDGFQVQFISASANG